LKIDRSFVSQLGGESRDREIIAAVTGMAHALGMRVIAEGVETEAQREELTAIGCDSAQGYLFAKPLTPNALAAMWKAQTSPESSEPRPISNGAHSKHADAPAAPCFYEQPRKVTSAPARTSVRDPGSPGARQLAARGMFGDRCGG
jgi:predicted signal transduction protein with EAL and GGDEF domain